jgi:hypothetical protein
VTRCPPPRKQSPMVLWVQVLSKAKGSRGFLELRVQVF